MCTIIEINQLRALGVNSMNRDDNGNTKTIERDCPRARLSSSSLNRAYRDAFNQPEDVISTRHIAMILKEMYAKNHPEADEETLKKIYKASASLCGASLEKDKVTYTTQVLTYSKAEIDMAYELLCKCSDKDINEMAAEAGKKDTKSTVVKKYRAELVKNTKLLPLAPEIAIFGRMVASGIGYDVMSARRTAHAYSVDAFHDDTDYFTTLDTYIRQMKKAEAGYIGSNTSIASNVMYMYSAIDPLAVYDNLVEYYEDRGATDAEKEAAIDTATDAVMKLVYIILTVLPKGKQSSMASSPVPSIAFVTMTEHTQNITMDNCFEKVITATDTKSVAEIAVDRMFDHINKDRFKQPIVDECLTDSQIDDYLSERTNDTKFGRKLEIPTSMNVNTISKIEERLSVMKAAVRKAVAEHAANGRY